MTWANADRAERAVDLAAAVIFAAAAGISLRAVALSLGAVTVAAVAGFIAAFFGLRQVTPGEPAFALPEFALDTIAVASPGEEPSDELVLDDELVEVGPGARVVRLFGPGRHHLPSNHLMPPPPDASKALSEALAELRRALH
jgi:hypothetical protein